MSIEAALSNWLSWVPTEHLVIRIAVLTLHQSCSPTGFNLFDLIEYYSFRIALLVIFLSILYKIVKKELKE